MRYSPIYNPNQQGVVLIVVLLFLILIALAGAMAVRQSNTDLKTATADQINTILLQSSDSANERLEAVINGSTTSEPYKEALSQAGLFGYYILGKNTQGNEYIYCFNPRDRKYLIKNATVKQGAGSVHDNNGYCDYTKPNGFTSDRQVVATQMNITTTPTTPATEAFSDMAIGKDAEATTSKKINFDFRATSILPSYSEPIDNTGTSCLRKSSIPVVSGTATTTPILTCLHTANTPSKMTYQQATLENKAEGTVCIPFGTGTLDTACTITGS